MIDGTYEEGIRDCMKFLKDNSKIQFDMPIEEFIELLRQLSGRKHR